MAAKPPKPPINNNYNNNRNQQLKRVNAPSSQSGLSASSSPSPLESSSTEQNCNYYNQKQNQSNNLDCSCTNISIMQLFHEMKQEFPTVPDHIVNQCVIDNCHDRETCINNLKRELESHPNSVQAYPSQILRNNYQNQNQNNSNFMCNNKVLLKPTRPAPVPKLNDNLNRINNSSNISNNSNLIKNECCDVNNLKKCELDKRLNRKPRNSVCDMQQGHQKSDRNNEKYYQQQKSNLQLQLQSQPQPQRPKTLSFREPISTGEGFVNINQNQQRLIHKPVRRAPLPPTAVKSQHLQLPSSAIVTASSLPSTQQQHQSVVSFSGAGGGGGGGNSDHSYSSAASIQSPLSFSDSGESEISVNISLSPSSERSQRSGGNGAVTRRTTSITVQPEPPYTRDFASQNPRSFTSLNLILRKPSTTPQSPIDITAGPGLTYSSSSFDARRGYQKSFHITVTDQGSTFSASRIRSRMTTTTAYNPSCKSYPEQQRAVSDMMKTSQQLQSNSRIGLNVPYSSSDNYCVYQQDAAVELIQRQRNRKEALDRCLQKNKQKLERVQNEIEILKSPVKPGESERLDNEIEKLRCDCQNILQEIENTKRNAIPSTNIDFCDNDQFNVKALDSEGQQKFYQIPLPSTNLTYHLCSPPGEMLSEGLSSPLRSRLPITTTVMLNQLSHQQSQAAAAINQQQFIDETNPDGGPPWTCSMCTFQNHPLLNKCECCDNVRQIPEPVVTSREDIHIHLSPGENRVIHSWIVS